MSAITLTFGECAENHVGMQKIGEKCEKGYTYEEMEKFSNQFEENGFEVVKYDLHNTIELYDEEKRKEVEEAYLYVIKGGCENADELYKEMLELEWDKKALMRGVVKNKNARYNLCFGNFTQEPNYMEGKGRVYNVADLRQLTTMKKTLDEVLEMNTQVEGNYYYDLKKCGIGYHGDAERLKTVGVRLGNSFPICYRLYQNSEIISETMEIMLDHGDIYIMSEKTTGNDWKKRKIVTYRHAAGCNKYIK